MREYRAPCGGKAQPQPSPARHLLSEAHGPDRQSVPCVTILVGVDLIIPGLGPMKYIRADTTSPLPLSSRRLSDHAAHVRPLSSITRAPWRSVMAEPSQ
jgi:hypothetical protein